MFFLAKTFLTNTFHKHFSQKLPTENPQILELMQKAPNAKAVEAELSAHIQEHLAFAYRQKIEEELGVALPPPNEALPEDIELRISRLVAPAAAQVTGKAQQMVQAEENAKRMQDPVVQMQQRELAIEEGKAMAKAQADMARIQLDLQKAQEKATLDREKIDSQERIESAKIGAKVASDAIRQEEIDSREAIEGAKMGMDLVKDLIEDE